MPRKQTKITKSAKGEACQIRVPGVCNFNPETTVACHLNGGGTGTKEYDFLTAYGCSKCHWFVDGGYSNLGFSRMERDNFHADGIFRTQKILAQKGLLIEA